MREGIELTSNFTATVNAEMKVGAVEETITVTGESPIVDTQSITARTVMTREVLDALPTGRNIQAVGIMIPGTALAVGGGGALSRDVGGSGTLQQSPLQYRGSGDTVQTIEGLRLNNLEAQGQYSGVYWNDASFEELSYITGADSAEMGQGGLRVNMVPRDGGNTFRGQAFANFTDGGWASDNCGSPGIGQPCTRSNLSGSTTFNPNNRLTNVSEIQRIWDFNPSIGGPILRDRLWFHYTFRHQGVEKTVADSYFDRNPSQFVYEADTDRKGVDDGHIVSNAGRVSWQASSKDKLSVYHDNQRKYRDHWGISSTVPPEAAGVQVTPTSFVNVTKWTRTHTSRLLLEGGFGYYNQEYTELYQPSVTGFDRQSVGSGGHPQFSGVHGARPVEQQDRQRVERTVRSLLSPPNVHGCSVLRDRVALLPDRRHGERGRLAGPRPVDRRHAADHLQRRAPGAGDAAPADRSPQRDQGRHRHLPAGSLDDGPRDVEPGPPLRLVHRRDAGERGHAEPFQQRHQVRQVRGRQERHAERDASARCRTGRTSRLVSAWRSISSATAERRSRPASPEYVAGQQIATANAANPVTVLGLTDTRPWNDLDGNGLPLDADGNIQFNELSASTADADLRTERLDDDDRSGAS